jgi:glycosyltransferase involved in cell wall biosynthesis
MQLHCSDESLPLVSIGMPIRNGASTLVVALESVLAQDYQNLEILISDNCSTDETQAICLKYAQKDKRIKYYKQEGLLTSLENFRYVLDNVGGDFFMWAADDDWRESGYISKLLGGMRDKPEVILSFGDVYITDDLDKDGEKKSFPFDSQNKSVLARMRKSAHIQCYHIYGVWRTHLLRGIPFNEISWWPDMPIMIAASSLGEFKYVEGVKFKYRECMRSNEESAQYLSYRKGVDKLRVFRLVWLAFKACNRVSSTLTAIFGALFVIEKQLKVVMFVIKRKFSKRVNANL